MYLSRAETETIDAAIARVEGRTGVQVVTAIVSKADAYAELPWMAFALGVSLAALVSVLVDRVRPDWITAHVALLSTVTVLAAGDTFTVLARNAMGEPIFATPAIVDEKIYLRTAEFLYCFGNEARSGKLGVQP